MTNGIFKSQGLLSYARAQDVMSTQSAVGFEWSVKLGGNGTFSVGIASRLQPKNGLIHYYDPNSILYSTYDRDICIGPNPIHSNLKSHKNGHVIRFRLQPQTKKLLIDFVRVNLFLKSVFKI